MADNVTADPGTGGAVFATDEIAGVHYPYTKLVWGPADAANVVDDASGKRVPVYVAETIALPVTDNGGALTVDGTVAVSGTVTVDSELTTGDLDTGVGTDTRAVVGLVLAESGGGTLVGSANPMPVSDNGGALTVDGTVSISGTVTVDSELTTADLDTGAGTDTRAVVGMVLAASGGGALVGTANPMPVSDNGGALTVDNGGTFAVQATQAGTWNVGTVTAVTDITNVVSVDDGGGALTVDGTVAISGTVTVDSELTTADLDTGAGTDTRAVVGLVGTASGGGQLIPGSSTDGLLVNLGTNNDVTVTGAVTANAGTNLNTSALALETGGNLATIAGAVKAEDAASADGHTGIPALAVRKATPANTSGADGDYENLQVSAGRLWVDPSGVTLTVGSHAVTNAGTFAVQAATAGDVAHDSPDSGSPVKVGAKATTALHSATMVADADRANLVTGTDGVLITRENSNLESLVKGTASITDGSSTSIIAAAGAGVKMYVTDIIIANSSATYVTVDIRDGTAGGVLATFPAPATSGCVHRLGSPIGGTANTALAADPSAAASTVTVTLAGFKSKI